MWKLLAVTAALVSAFLAFAPPQVGGSTSYVITSGTSMLPDFHAGDLVLVRREARYHVGEVAAYHNGQLGVVVLHRIIAIRGDHYLFKGDNNNFTDSFEPMRGEIVGAEWIHLPGVGGYLLRLHSPVVAAVILSGLWLLAFSPPARSRRQRRRHRSGG